MTGWIAALGVAYGLTDDEIAAVWDHMGHLSVPMSGGPMVLLAQFREAAEEADITLTRRN